MVRLRSMATRVADRAGMNAAIAMGAEAELKAHLHANYVPRSKRTGWWGKALASVESSSDGGGASIRIPHRGVALRYFGGTVTPGKTTSTKTGRPTRSLSVGVDDSVAGKLPSEVGPLVFLPSKKSGVAGVLLRGTPKTITRGPRKGGTRYVAGPNATVLYALMERTRHTPDPGIVPDEKLGAAAVEAAGLFIDQETQ